jgi:PAS domain S-box-containing protein
MKERQFSVLIAAAAPEDRAAMRDALSRDPAIHYAVIEAESGLRALEPLRAWRPDCMILDHDLPDLSTLEELKRLSAEEGTPACGVVMLVGEGDVRLAVEAMESGAHSCLEKGRARGEELLHAVSYAIQKAGRQRSGAERERVVVEEAWRVARAGAGSQRAAISRQGDVFHNRAEEQLRLLKTAIEQSNESVMIMTARLDPPGSQIVYVNPVFTKMTGYAPEDVIGKTPNILQGPKTDRSALNKLCEACAAGKVFHCETINYRKDRSEIHLEWHAGPVRNERGEVTHIAAAQRDVTERRRVEEKLRRSEEEFRSLFELSAIGMTQVSPEGRYLRVNRKLCQMLGYSEQELLQLTLHEVTHPDDRDVSAAKLSASFADGSEEFSIEKRYVRKDGAIIWVLINWTVVPQAEGCPRRTVANIQDITERKQAEEAIIESESRLRQLADAMPQIVYTCGPDGLVDYANQRWGEYVGVPVEQSLGFKWIEAIHPDDREITRRRLREAGETGQPFETEYRLRRKDGQYRWYLARGSPIRNAQGRIVKWIGTSTDIHDRKEAEAEREESLDRERAACSEAEHSAESIRRLQAVTDSALRRLELDDLLHEMLARIRELLEADSAAILLATDDRQSLVVRSTIGLDEAIGFRVPVGKGVAGSIAASRAPLVVEDLSPLEVINPLLRRNARSLIGAPLIVEERLIGVVHADTAQLRRFTEDDVRLLRLAADRVALAIEHARLYEVERQARRQAEEANRMKDEFLAVVSHELRTPLNAILGYARLLRRGPRDHQGVEQATEVIERNGMAQSRLIDDLLDTASIISGKLGLEIGPVDLASVIEEAVQTIRPAADAKGISIQAELPPEVGQITGDPIRLRQVLWNLVSNAVKFTPQGGRVEARLERIDPHICITVSDTGKGIKAEFLPFVFDRFRQADASITRRHGGLGLGLSLVKYLVELHGGTIAVASEGEGRGTTFKILLPVRAIATPVGEAGGAPVAVKDTEQAAMLAGVRALAVEDEDDARELINVALSQYGAEVIAASSAAEAYTMLTTTPARERPDVMVADIGMPGEDGYDLVRRLRVWERERGLHIPAVALTAYGRVEDRVRALKAGFQAHVTKPVEPAELAVVIASLMSKRARESKQKD